MDVGATPLTIGELAKRAGVHVQTIRYYERRGLLAEPDRTASNYRIYAQATCRRVRFIKRAQGLGFTLKEIKELLALRAGPGAYCADVRRRAEDKVRDIEDKVRALRAMQEALAGLIEGCSGDGPATQCPILGAMDEEND